MCPKIDSLIDCFEELHADIAIITETWLKDGSELDLDMANLQHGAGICGLTQNCPPNQAGISHGGVAVLYKKKIGSFKKIDFPNPDNFEVLPVIGSFNGSSRKVVVVAAYIPPNYTVARGAACLEDVESVIIEAKRRFRDPYIITAGDFNQWNVADALQDFQDITEVDVGPTRGDRCLDRIFCNVAQSIKESGTVPPLESDHSKSDHKLSNR